MDPVQVLLFFSLLIGETLSQLCPNEAHFLPVYCGPGGQQCPNDYKCNMSPRLELPVCCLDESNGACPPLPLTVTQGSQCQAGFRNGCESDQQCRPHQRCCLGLCGRECLNVLRLPPRGNNGAEQTSPWTDQE